MIIIYYQLCVCTKIRRPIVNHRRRAPAFSSVRPDTNDRPAVDDITSVYYPSLRLPLSFLEHTQSLARTYIVIIIIIKIINISSSHRNPPLATVHCVQGVREGRVLGGPINPIRCYYKPHQARA